MTKVKRLFWDVEVSPNVALLWRPGSKIAVNPEAIIKERQTICVGFKWQGESAIRHLQWDARQDDRVMLRDFIEIAKEADELVAHFGDSYDLPWLRARCLIQGLDPLPIFKTVDTCQIARRYYLFNSDKLDYIGQALGLGNKIRTDYSLWKDIVLHRSPSALKNMVAYCKRDVALLEGVWERLQTASPAKTHAGVLIGHAKWTCPRCGSTNVKKSKTRVSASGTKTHQMQCVDDGSYYTISDTVYREYEKRHEPKAKAHRKADTPASGSAKKRA